MSFNGWSILICILKYYHKIRYIFLKFYYRIKYQIEDSSATIIVEVCNSSYNNKQIYRLLKLYLLKCGSNYDFVRKAEEFNEIIKAKFLGDILIISTSNQSKMPSFILFIDDKKNKIIYKEVNIGNGIISLKLLKSSLKFSNKLLEVRYLKNYGTGFIAQNIKIFLISDNDVFSIFDKTIFEIISGWKAFKNDDEVEFGIKYKLSWKNKLLYLTTCGYVNIGDKRKDLPREVYVYDDFTRQFKQLEGRRSSDMLLSEIYGDQAKPNGHWFVKPCEVKEKYSLYCKW